MLQLLLIMVYTSIIYGYNITLDCVNSSFFTKEKFPNLYDQDEECYDFIENDLIFSSELAFTMRELLKNDDNYSRIKVWSIDPEFSEIRTTIPRKIGGQSSVVAGIEIGKCEVHHNGIMDIPKVPRT